MFNNSMIIDMGFRNMLLGYRDADRGHILKNIVYLELLRRDYRVCIGKAGETEVDFIAEKPDDKVYIQVTESMLSPETRERELRPLQMIPDNYEKIVLSMDRDFIKSYDGIKSLNLMDWLLDEKQALHRGIGRSKIGLSVFCHSHWFHEDSRPGRAGNDGAIIGI